MSAEATVVSQGPQWSLRFHLDPAGHELALRQPGAVFVRSEVPFVVGEARYCAGVPHRVGVRSVLRLWPMGDRTGAVQVYR